MRESYKILLLIVATGLVAACSSESDTVEEEEAEEEVGNMYFDVVSEDASGISFTNALTETDTFNYMNFEYMYNGAGVAVGDINNDGLADLYFTGNQVSDKLYLNKGEMKFEDITEKAIGSKASEGWHTGVTMADVNGDGLLDIYVSRSGLPTFNDKLTNLLYINNGDNTFTESAEKLGATGGNQLTNQSAFFDMDNDGDLDLYVMNRPFADIHGQFPNHDFSNLPESDVLLENQDGQFVDVSKKAGIDNRGYGLGIAVCDINMDGWQDLYVSNDYIQPDFLYINQGNGTFKDELIERTNHTSQFGMGNDVADYNNDGYTDIMVLDMVSEDHVLNKQTMGGMSTIEFWGSVDAGNQYEYMFNSLQLNNGNGTFSEIAQVAGVSKTDWSWAPLFADFDNDGLKDLFITNGYRKDVRNSDYAAMLKARITEVDKHEEILGEATVTKTPNYIFKNSGDLKFDKVMDEWKMDIEVNSNGAAYADLDNDGDLDLVLNNMEDRSFIMENKQQTGNHYLRVKCDDKFDGAKVTLQAGGETFYQEMYATRGYQSSVERVLHFGLGKNDKVDLIIVQFPDGKEYSQKNLGVDELITIKYAEATPPRNREASGAEFFVEANAIDHTHEEIFIDDYAYEILLPHKMSQLGPFVSSGDVNGDGLEDMYISGSRYKAGALYVQGSNGKFSKKSGPWEKETEREEMGSVFFDIDGDGDMDLYVCSGGNEHYTNSYKMRDQIYVNDGSGKFTNETQDRLPMWLSDDVVFATSAQRPAVGDIDGDGDLDLFIGGRQVPGQYPFAPRSFLLENNDGVFKDVTENSPDIISPGMITESIFDDIDGDNDLDLICVGEWMPISFFENNKGTFKNVTAKYNLAKTVGWWMSITKGDFNGDGKNDYVVGNIGENNKFHPSTDHPLEVYVADFDNNGTFDIVLGEYQNDKCYPIRGRSCSSQQMPFIADKFPTFNEFSVADLPTIYGQQNLESSLHYSATHFSSAVVLSGADGYTVERLPTYAQLGPVNQSIVWDVNQDGNLDIIGVGNNFAAEIETVRYDGGRGVVLLGDGKGSFEQLAPQESGFFVNTDAKDMVRIGNMILVSSNNAKVKAFKFLGDAS